MGTRNLTMVIQKEEPKVAQYGQWDGYPEGQDVTALEFLRHCDFEKFSEKLDKVSFITEEELDKIGDNWEKTHSHLSRDVGAKILELVYQGACDKLTDNTLFAGDSLFCEWAYVIDMDKETFEVYKGFNSQPLNEDQRFYKMPAKSGYYPVSMIKSYSLRDLPSKDKFIDDFRNEES